MDETTKLILTFLIPALGGAFIGSIPGIMTARNQRNNSFVDNAEKITKSALIMVEPMREDITMLRSSNKELVEKAEILTKRVEEVEKDLELAKKEIKELVDKLDIWIDGAERLYTQIIEKGITPAWAMPTVQRGEKTIRANKNGTSFHNP